MLISYLREIWHFKPKRLLHQGIVNGSIANFFAILLQYNSKHRIVLFTVLQKKKLYFTPPISLEISLSSLSFFLFSSLSSFSVLHLLSPLWSFIAEISHPSHTASLSSLIAWPLSHCTGAGFWIFEVGGWISVDRWAGFGSLGWDRLMVGLDRLIGGFEMVDLLIGGRIIWVDHW